eukprot:12296650-Alexandrium_andersonii.AAC.1
MELRRELRCAHDHRGQRPGGGRHLPRHQAWEPQVHHEGGARARMPHAPEWCDDAPDEPVHSSR